MLDTLSYTEKYYFDSKKERPMFASFNHHNSWLENFHSNFHSMVDILQKELVYGTQFHYRILKKQDYVNDIVIYDLCGYIIKARSCVTIRIPYYCPDCYKTVRCEQLDLPNDFNVDHFTGLRNRGGLVFVTANMFKTFYVIERIIKSHFQIALSKFRKLKYRHFSVIPTVTNVVYVCYQLQP